MVSEAAKAVTPRKEEFRFARFTLQPGRQLLVDGNPVAIGAKALNILTVLAEAQGGLVTKDQLIERVWPGQVIEENTLQSHISAIRKALGTHGSWITTIAGQGYRFSGPREDDEASPVPAKEAPPITAPSTVPSRKSMRVRIGLGVGIAAALAGVAVITSVAWRRTDFAPSRPVAIERVLVLPFVNRTGNPRNDDFADTLSDAVSGRIATQAWDSQIVSHQEAFRYKGQPLDEAKLAAQFGLSYIIVGSMPPGEAGLEATATIIDARSDAQIAVVSARAPTGNPEAGLQLLAPGLVDQILSTIFRYEKRQIANGREDDSDIRNLLLRAETSWGEPTIDNRASALALIQRALELDPRNVHALTLAGATRINLAADFAYSDEAERNRLLDQAQDDLEAARRIDPMRQVVHLKLGDLRAAQGRRDAARAEFQRVLDLDPTDTHALNRLALEDVYADQPNTALPRLDQARQFNPDDEYLIDGGLAVIRLVQGQNEEALASIRRAVAVDASDPWGWIYLAGLLQMTGRTDEARPAVETLRKLAPGITIAKLRLGDANTGPHYREAREKLYEALRQVGIEP